MNEMQISERFSIEKVKNSWVLRGGHLEGLTFTRLRHACQYLVDSWAGEAVRECQSATDVLDHVGDRLHDAITMLGKARTKLMLIDVEGLEKDRERLDWLLVAEDWTRKDIDAVMAKEEE